jgi:hypothetical protein
MTNLTCSLRYNEYRQNPNIIPNSILFGGTVGIDHCLEGIYAPTGNGIWEVGFAGIAPPMTPKILRVLVAQISI